MVHKTRLAIFSLIFLTALLSESASRSFQFEPSQSRVEFLAVGTPSMLKIKGKSGKISGTLTQLENKFKGKIQVDLRDFDTGMALRNKHMKEKYLHVQDEKNRYATLELLEFSTSDLLEKSGTKNDIPFKANLTLHGIEKEVSGLATLTVEKEEYSGSTKLRIKLSDFGIDIPSFAGVTVAEDVDIDVMFKGQILNGKE